MKPTTADLRTVRQAVLDAVRGRPTLQEFLTRLHRVHPDLDEALEGIYCGREGRIVQPLDGWGRNICFGWYTTETRKAVVEWAYIS